MVTAFETKALALGGLELLWPLNDAAGATVAADSSGKNLPGTYSAAKVNGAENVLGAGPGMAVSSTLAVSRAVAAGSGLAAPQATLFAWVTPSSLPTANAVIAGRNNHLRLAFNTNGQIGMVGFTTAGNVDLRLNGNLIAAASTYFVVATYHGTRFRLYINGVLVQETVIVSTLANVTDTFYAGTGSSLTGTLSMVGEFSRALTVGEVYDLYLAGTKDTPVTPGVKVDNWYATSLPVVGGAGARCAGCHGARVVNETTVLHGTANERWHLSCYALRSFTKPIIVPDASTPWAAYEGPILRLIEATIRTQTERVTNVARLISFDGTTMVSSGSTNIPYDSYGPWALLGAMVASRLNMTAEHWLVDLTVQCVEKVWAAMDPATGNLVDPNGGTGGIDFVLASLGEAVVYLQPILPVATYARWLANLVKVGTYMITPQNGGTPESSYYVNGNREAWEMTGYWMLYEATDDPAWKTRYETQRAFLASPPANAGSSNPYGWVQLVAPTGPNGQGGMGFFIERNPAHIGDPLYRTVLGPDGTHPDGFDQNYSEFCLAGLVRAYLWNHDPLLLPYINMIYNLLIRYVNTTSAPVQSNTLTGQSGQPTVTVNSMAMDGRGGDRQSNLSSFANAAIPLLLSLGQTNVTPTILAQAFSEQNRFLMQDLINQPALSRTLGTGLGSWLRLFTPPSARAYS